MVKQNSMVSVILVNWNGEKWLEKCYKSLLDQTYENIEIILSDNGSSDNSIRYTRKNFPSVKIVEVGENLGFAGGNNRGISSASGKYILLLNTDAWFERDAVWNLVKFYERNSYDVIAPFSTGYDDTPGNEMYVSKIDSFGQTIYFDRDKNSFDDSFYLSGVSLLFEKKMYVETLGLDDNFFMYMEEIDWFWRLILLKKTFSHVDGVYVHHATSGSTGKGINYKRFLWRNQNIPQLFLKNYHVSTMAWVIPLYVIQNVIEALFFLITGKPRIAISYLEGWRFVFENFSKIIQKRRWVQANRLVNDRVVLGRMAFGTAKITSLLRYYMPKKSQNES